MATGKKTACVTGGTGYVAGLLVKQLLEKGYAVNATVRNPNDEKKVSPLLKLPGKYNDLKIFKADLTDEGSYDEAIAGCHIVFHVATPVHFHSEDPENEMIKPAIQGTLNVLKSVTKKEMVKRVVLTSSVAAVSINKLKGGYAVSKTLAEKAAWKFAEENRIDLITITPSLTAGPSLTPDVPSSMSLAMALLTGNSDLVNDMKGMQILTGSITITHVEDVVEAHIFLAENESASGRYTCCPINTSLPELAKFLNNQYPQYNVPTE